jgi:hypothetical protein
MGTLYQSKELFETLLRVGRENKLPVRVSKEFFSRMPFLPALLKPTDAAAELPELKHMSTSDWKKRVSSLANPTTK